MDKALDDIRKDLAVTVQVLLLNGREAEAKQYLKQEIAPNKVERLILKAVRPLMREGSFVKGLDKDFPARCFFNYLADDKPLMAKAILQKGKTVDEVKSLMLDTVKGMLRSDFYFADRFLDAVDKGDKKTISKMLLEHETVEDRIAKINDLYLWTDVEVNEDHAVKQLTRSFKYSRKFNFFKERRDLFCKLVRQRKTKILKWAVENMQDVTFPDVKDTLKQAIQDSQFDTVDILIKHPSVDVLKSHLEKAKNILDKRIESALDHHTQFGKAYYISKKGFDNEAFQAEDRRLSQLEDNAQKIVVVLEEARKPKWRKKLATKFMPK